MREECKDCNRSLEDCTCIEDTIEFTEADIETFTDWIFNPAEPNQALKDAAERYSEIYRCPATNENEYCRHDIISAFNNGAKWQQERSYSEEDMLKSFMAGIKCESNNGKNFEQFIKQFKNK